MRVYRLISAIILLTSVYIDLSARLDWGDQGDGTFINPVLNADYSVREG